MLDYALVADELGGDDVLEVPLGGLSLLDCPMFNKGSAFTAEERDEFGLHGLLPPHVGSIDEQLERRYQNFQEKRTDLQQHIYLRDLQDRNEVLFYRLLRDHIGEMMPLIYTPVVGEACRNFSHIYRRPRGLFLSAERPGDVGEILANRPFREVDVIVATDGERILGLGDLGIGGIGIPVGKLSLYTLCGGIDPSRTLPIVLDVGTDNPETLADPLYLGWRHPRLRGEAYADFIEAFVQAVGRAMPHALLQWEDFATCNARPLLDRYRDRICSFNDDIQGTAAVALAAVIAGGAASGMPLRDQRVVILGAGSAGVGIADGLVAALVAAGMTEPMALDHIWLVDRDGLLIEGMAGLDDHVRRFAKPLDRVDGWRGRGEPGGIGLLEVLHQVRPTALIGTTGQPGVFTERVVRSLASLVDRPILLPMSNPTSRSEAKPADLVAWTDGRALIATGSPFADVVHRGRTIRIAQCNNAYIFPGVGLGVIASGARKVDDAMFAAAARTLAAASPARVDPDLGLFPGWDEIGIVSRRIAASVGVVAGELGLAPPTTTEGMAQRVEARWWEPRYRPMRRPRER